MQMIQSFRHMLTVKSGSATNEVTFEPEKPAKNQESSQRSQAFCLDKGGYRTDAQYDRRGFKRCC